MTGRIGYTVLPTLLVYAKAGGAFVHDLYNIATPDGEAVPFLAGTMTVAPSTAVFNPTVAANGIVIAAWRTCGCSSSGGHPRRIGQPAPPIGWTVGFGAEWAFAHAPVSLSLEYSLPGFRQHAGALHYLRSFRDWCFPIDISQKHPHRPVRDQLSFRWRRRGLLRPNKDFLIYATMAGVIFNQYSSQMATGL